MSVAKDSGGAKSEGTPRAGRLWPSGTAAGGSRRALERRPAGVERFRAPRSGRGGGYATVPFYRA